MHIPDGVLSTPTLVGGGLLALAGVGYGLRKLDSERIMSVAILTAAFFVITLIHLPGDLHLILHGLMGVMLGWTAFPAMAVALLLQSILFQFGGLTSIGVNISIVAYPAVLCGVCFRPYLKEEGHYVAAFFCGMSAVILSVLAASVFLLLSSPKFLGTAVTFGLGYLPVMLVEGIVTALIYGRLIKMAPKLFQAK